MRIIFLEGGEIISQFQGYDALEEVDLEAYQKKYGPDLQGLDKLLQQEGKNVNNYKVSKQADVLMLFYLFSHQELKDMFERLGHSFSQEMIPINIDYYLKRTVHGSSLSRVVHAWVLASSQRTASWEMFEQALESDVGNRRGGTTSEGIHLGAMASTIDLISRGYPGIVPRNDALWLDPYLPETVEQLSFKIQYRGHRLSCELTKTTLKIISANGTQNPIYFRIQDQKVELKPGETKVIPLSEKHCQEKEPASSTMRKHILKTTERLAHVHHA